MINIRDMKLNDSIIRSIINTEHCLFISCINESKYVYVKEFNVVLSVNDDSMIHDEDGEILADFNPSASDGSDKIIYSRIKEKYADTVVENSIFSFRGKRYIIISKGGMIKRFNTLPDVRLDGYLFEKIGDRVYNYSCLAFHSDKLGIINMQEGIIL